MKKVLLGISFAALAYVGLSFVLSQMGADDVSSKPLVAQNKV